MRRLRVRRIGEPPAPAVPDVQRRRLGGKASRGPYGHDAVRNAVKTASHSIRQITGVEELHSTAEVGETGELTVDKVQCKIAFLVESSLEHEGIAASAAVAASSTGAASARGTG